MKVAKISSKNLVVEFLEIPEMEEQLINNFINNELGIRGNWIDVSFYEKKSNKIIEIGDTYHPYKRIFIKPSPYESWILNQNNEWEAPEKDIIRTFGHGYITAEFRKGLVRWSEERKKWYHSWYDTDFKESNKNFFDQENNREFGIFFVHKLIEPGVSNKTGTHPYINVQCDPIIMKYDQVHPDWSNNGYVDPLFVPGGYGEAFGVAPDNPNKNQVHQDFKVIYYGSPVFQINWTSLVNLNQPVDYPEGTSGLVKAWYKYTPSPELEKLYLQQHPQLAGRTMGELFRLIIDWDLAYHHFDNRENIALMSHSIMSSINMPQEIYMSIITNIPDSCVSKYIQGDPDALNFGEKPTTPKEVIDWFKDKYWSLRHIQDDSGLVNISNIDENHYRI